MSLYKLSVGDRDTVERGENTAELINEILQIC
jgi:hypothetical protein